MTRVDCISDEIDIMIKRALEEDIGSGDITCQSIFRNDSVSSPKGKARIISRQEGVISGALAAGQVFKIADNSLDVFAIENDGCRVSENSEIIIIEGRLTSILKAERTALNFLGHMSGIATTTRAYVDKISGTKAKIYDTRKTLPNLRAIEKYSVASGGGENHRMGLFDQVLIKENHIKAFKSSRFSSRAVSIKDLLASAKKALNCRQEIIIEIEVRNKDEFELALAGFPDIILLDNMDVNAVKQAVDIRNQFASENKNRPSLPLLEVSGNINLSNVREFALTGVERISVGALTHSADIFDFSLILD